MFLPIMQCKIRVNSRFKVSVILALILSQSFVRTEAAPEVLCKKGDHKNFAGKHQCWSVFLIKLQTWGVFLWNLQNFSEHLEEHLRTTASVRKTKGDDVRAMHYFLLFKY